MSERGVIVGCDREQEWLLPWWWEHYSTHNSYPVSFIDFGLSKEGKKWCEQKGSLIPLSLPHFSISSKADILSSIRRSWEKRFGKEFWGHRLLWLKKPFALLQSPYDWSLWTDLDCQIKGDVDPLFHTLGLGIDLALAWDEAETIDGLHLEEILYNGGVIAFRSQSPILRHWTDGIVKYQHLLPTDQEILARVIHLHKPPFLELSPLFNWPRTWGENPKTLIHHFFG